MKQQHILNFWRDVEVFNLPDFNNDCSLLTAASFPWQTNKPLKNPRANVWRYTLLFGRIAKKDVIDTIERLLDVEDPPSDWEEPVTGDTCLSAIILDQNGQPNSKSYIPAAFIFGINCLESNVSIAKVPQKLDEAQSDFELRYNIPPVIDEESERKGPPVIPQYLQEEIKYLEKITKDWNKTPIEIYVVAKEVPKDAEPDTSFLNSFYLNDLNTLINIDRKHYGTALNSYLSLTVDQLPREDMIADRVHLCRSIDPALMPMGRWPAKIQHGLYTAQAGAVNTTLTDLKNSAGIRGINGPPGTGKTTLLLDIIAEVVVARAQKLMQISPDKLFGRYTKIEREDSFSGYYEVISDALADSGIVVASNNNAAVENITKALPSTDKIDATEFKYANYFADYAQRLIDGESWGILSAPLGNAQNRANFKWKFWLSDVENEMPGFQDLLWSVYKSPDHDQTYIYQQKFETVRDELEELINDFNAFKQTASYFHNQYPVFQHNRKLKNEYEDELRVLQDNVVKLSGEESRCNSQLKETDELIQLTRKLLDLIKEQKPAFFFFHKLLNTGKYKGWRTGYDQNMRVLQEHINKKMMLTKQLNSIRSEVSGNQTRISGLESKLITVYKAIEQYLELKKELSENYGISHSNIVDEEFYTAPLENIQLRTPYSSETINRLRSNIFLKSLELHQYCILSNAKKVRNNLNLFFEMTEGRAKVDQAIAETLWSTLFLCIPVISTTLASVSRLFASMRQESIGWLLLDEAGQATPQSAAGIIWRCKRCIVVGDPLQIEPVVTIPSALVYKLRQQEGVEQVWSPCGSSVQILADRVSKQGTYMLTGDADQKIWTGFPLRTHRRCDNPMFDIANRIAYSGQMVKATKDSLQDGYIGNSTWFHIVSNEPPINKHVLTEELALLDEKINALRATGFNGEIFVISPFKSVANVCVSEYRYKSGISCGTIHRFQGKEADVVSLVLGGNPHSQGARNWVARNPNMLNVALTRAKKRFYVIGNRNLWATCRYFDTMAAGLKANNA